MNKILKYFIIFIVLLLIVIQFVPVSRTNPPVTSDIQTSDNIKAILKRSCYDCHSNESSWPWYSKVAPASWFVINHVNEARDEYNFSTWDKYSQEKKSEIMEEIWEEVDEGKMPIWNYVILHPDAKLSAADKKELHNWVATSLPPGALEDHNHDDEEEDD
jgi:hypothetical protein